MKLFNELIASAWWVSVVLAGLVYVLLRYVVPAMFARNPFVMPFAKGVAGPLAFLILLAAPLSLVRSWRQRRLLDRQTGIDSIRAMSWQQFEELVGEAYRRAGYQVRHTGRSGPDGGIDLVLEKDGKWLVQCKHWKNYKVGVKEVRELYGLVHAEHAQGGILVTVGAFTPEVRDFAEGKPLRLVDGPALVAFVRDVQLARADARLPARPDAPTPPRCPSCARPMILRTAHRGPSAGRQFWGCPGYPTCRAIVEL
jgi:restriction system protein